LRYSVFSASLRKGRKVRGEDAEYAKMFFLSSDPLRDNSAKNKIVNKFAKIPSINFNTKLVNNLSY